MLRLVNKLLTTTILFFSFGTALFSGNVNGEVVSRVLVNQLGWLTGQRHGSHDGGILEQTWLPPRSGTITALVRSTRDSDTRFVEIIHVREVSDSLELNLQIFNNSLEPENISATHSQVHTFKLSEVGKEFLAFKGVSEGAHRSLSYHRSKENFLIRIETNDGEKIEIRLTPVFN